MDLYASMQLSEISIFNALACLRAHCLNQLHSPRLQYNLHAPSKLINYTGDLVLGAVSNLIICCKSLTTK